MPDQLSTTKEWVAIAVRTTLEAVEATGEILRRVGCAGWVHAAPDTIVGYLPVSPHVGERIADVWAEVRALSEYGLDAGPGDVQVTVIPDRHWAELVKNYFHPVRVGRVLLCPTWEEARPGPKEVLLRLDPGMAFGSGAHATTRLCLLALQEELSPGGRVLDLGTGSGILAIAAALLGASRVVGIDTDPEVLPIASENARINSVSSRVELIHGDIRAAPRDNWQVIVANIAPAPVIEAASVAADLLGPEGAFIAGGIPQGQEMEIRDALAAAGFSIPRVLREEEWVAFVARPGLAVAES